MQSRILLILFIVCIGFCGFSQSFGDLTIKHDQYSNQVIFFKDGKKAGDAFDSFSDTAPTFNRYELGYFVGISYNILR